MDKDIAKLSFATVVKSLLKFKAKNGGYKIKPLDLILFKGEDAMIQNIEEKWVKHHDRKPDGTLWTHVGIIVDKTILPLDCLEDDKLYIYESIFTGTVVGYTYSRVFPVDHPFQNGKTNHSGPQIRPFVGSCLETNADIAIAPLKISERHKLFQFGLQHVQKIMMEHYLQYSNYGYPMSVIPQFAAASDGLYNFISNAKSATKKVGHKLKSIATNNKQETSMYEPIIEEQPKSDKKPTKKAVFCSQLAAMIYEALEMTGFEKGSSGKFTPVELNASECFEQEDLYVKLNGKFLVSADGQTLMDI